MMLLETYIFSRPIYIIMTIGALLMLLIISELIDPENQIKKMMNATIAGFLAIFTFFAINIILEVFR